MVAVIVASGIARTAAEPDPDAPLPLVSVSAPGAIGAACAALDSALPATLGDRPRRALRYPEPGVAAWGDPPAVLRCGLPTPAELTCAAALQQVNGVAWLALSADGSTTFLAVDRPVRVAVTVPDSAGTGALQDASTLVAATLPTREVCRGGVLLPTEDG